jgi:hypothetical protein
LVAVVDCNNHNLIDLVDEQVDFAVDIDQQKHYFFVPMVAAVVVVALVHIPPLLLVDKILPRKIDFIKR